MKLVHSPTYWLGGTDEKNEGVWEWITGEAWKFTKWAANEPNNLEMKIPSDLGTFP